MELEDWLSKAENGDRIQGGDGQMDWRPENEVLIPQVEGGVQMRWAWGHERPDSRVWGEMEDWNKCGGEGGGSAGSGERRREEMGKGVEEDDEGVR